MESKNRPKGKYIKIKRRKNGRCFLCGKYGHYKKEYIKYKRNNFFNQNHKNKSMKTQRKMNSKHIKNKINNKHIYSLSKYIYVYEDNYSEDFSKDYNCNNAIEINSLEVANNINDNNNNKNNTNFITWILDSGASISTTNDINHLINIKKCKTKLLLANGKEVLSEFSEDFQGYINNYKFTLKNVYYSRYIKRNLISINQLISQNYKVIFNNYNNKPQALIYDNKGNRIYKATSNNKNTYQIITLIHQTSLYSTKNKEINYLNFK